MYDRLEAVKEKYSGKALLDDAGESVDGWVVFDNRKQARQAASEVVGDLGSEAKAIRLNEYDASDSQYWFKDANKVVGRGKVDPENPDKYLSYWRDDQYGHIHLDGEVKPPHVNVNVDGIDFHFVYKNGGLKVENGKPVAR